MEIAIDSSSLPIVDSPVHLQTRIKVSTLMFPSRFIKLHTIYSDELKNSINKILHTFPTVLYLGEDFSNMSRTYHSTMTIPSSCTSVVAYVPPA